MNSLTLPAIFCPKCSALILDQPQCPHCAWARPRGDTQVGALAWNDVADIRAKVGGVRGRPACQPATAEGVICFGSESAGLVAVLTSTGEIKWRKPFSALMIAHQIISYERNFIAAVTDARPVHEAGMGKLQCWSVAGELLWEHQARNFNIVGFTVHNGRVYFSTADKHLHCYDIARQKELWEVELTHWLSYAPCVAADRLYLAGGIPAAGVGVVLCYSLDGKFIWEKNIEAGSHFAPMSHGEVLIVGAGEQKLCALDLGTGSIKWTQAVGESGYTSAPTLVGRRLYIGGKGYNPNRERVYALFALDLDDGRELWRAAVSKHIYMPPLAVDDAILCGTEAGEICAVSTQGAPLWRYAVKERAEHVRTHLALAGSLVIFGTRNGLVHAVRWKESSPEDFRKLKPRDLLKGGDVEGAAIVYALQGNLKEAAKLYEEEVSIRDLDRAILLYQKANKLGDAGRACEIKGEWDKALQFYHEVKDDLSQARMKIKLGDDLGAAQLYEAAGNYVEAAQGYERGLDNANAIRLYRQLGDPIKVSELAKGRTRIDALIEAGKFEEAAQEALTEKEFLLAADLFHRLNDFERELETLVKHGETYSDWARVPDIARRLGKFEIEAEARAKLYPAEENLTIAQAYHRAAHQCLQKDSSDEARASKLFELAMSYYRKAHELEKETECHSQFICYGKLACIHIDAEQTTGFQADEFNDLKLLIKNVGYGVAENIHITPEGDFELQRSMDNVDVDGIRDGKYAQRILSLKSVQIGGMWLHLNVNYTDERSKRVFSDKRSVCIQVHASDSGSQTGPITYNITGDYIQNGGKTVVEGDYLQEGAQKGDRIVINRVGLSENPSVLVWSEPGKEAGTLRKVDEPTRSCPHCTMPMREDDSYCQACGNKV